MIEPVLALSRNDVADYVSTLVTVYFLLIFVRIIISYFTRIPYNRFLAAFIGFVTDVTDPYLGLFRRFIPPIRIGGIALDITPIIALLVLQIVGGIVVSIIRPGLG